MSRRQWTLLVALVIAIGVGAELAVRPGSSSKSCIQIVNEGDGTMDDLVASYADTRLSLGRLAAGESVKAWFTGAGRATLTLDFKQVGSALKGVQIQEFDPVANRRSGSKLVLIVKHDHVEQFVEDDDSVKNIDTLLDRIRELVRR
jgi:hypothetical protein